MATATRIKCPTCGAKNPEDASRCATCTRALDLGASPIEEAYTEVLYASPVRDTERPTPWVGPVWKALLVVLLLVMVNYQWWGLGPSWAHRPELGVERGSTWRTVNETDRFTIGFPADARIDSVETPVGTAERAVAAVDGRWVTDRGATNRIGVASSTTDDDVEATVVVIAADAPAELTDEVAVSLLAATLPGVELDDTEVREIDTAAYGTQRLVNARFSGGLARSDLGRVRARVIAHEGDVFVIATFSKGSLDAELQSRLTSGFRPNGVHEAPDRGD